MLLSVVLCGKGAERLLCTEYLVGIKICNDAEYKFSSSRKERDGRAGIWHGASHRRGIGAHLCMASPPANHWCLTNACVPQALDRLLFFLIYFYTKVSFVKVIIFYSP